MVFEADLSTAPRQSGTQWTVTFAGTTLQNTSMVDVEFRAGTGGRFTLAETVTLDASDQSFTVDLGNTTEAEIFVRFLFTPDNANDLPIIDHLMITLAPEPSALVTAMAALAGLGASRGRRG